MNDTVLYTYKAPKVREPTDAERAQGIAEPQPIHHPGVPLRDLTVADVEAMPTWLQDTIADSDLYAATPEGKRHRAAIMREREATLEEVPAPTVLVKPAAKVEKDEKP
jgi:hypothetical protein